MQLSIFSRKQKRWDIRSTWPYALPQKICQKSVRVFQVVPSMLSVYSKSCSKLWSARHPKLSHPTLRVGSGWGVSIDQKQLFSVCVSHWSPNKLILGASLAQKVQTDRPKVYHKYKFTFCKHMILNSLTFEENMWACLTSVSSWVCIHGNLGTT